MRWYWPFGARGALRNTVNATQDSGPPAPSTKIAKAVTDERALGLSAVFACVRLIVQSGATLPLKFYEKTADGREELDDDHVLPRLLKYQPNLYMTAKQFRQAMFTQRVLRGNAYALKKFIGDRIVSITPLNPAFMDVIRKPSGLIYKYTVDGSERRYSQKDIMHLKGFSADGIMGLSPLSYAAHTLGISVSADDKAATSFSSMPALGLKLDSMPTQEQREQLRELYAQNTDTTGDGGMWMFPMGIDPQVIGLNPSDLQMLESREFQTADIARFFGVPTVMIDGTAGATAAWPASYEQQVLAFLTFTLKPYLEEMEDQITASLVPPAEKLTVFAEHEVEGFLRADSASRAEYHASGLQNGWTTINEVRRKENLPPIEGGDIARAQLNMAPITDLGESQNVPQ